LFIDEFIRSEYMDYWTSEKDSDFINEPERAARCHDAAEDGCDGKTHAEVIEDWREAFSTWMRATFRHGGCDGFNRGDRFSDAVNKHFDAVEAWHQANGSLDREIG
jgi:hypothetical protein